MKLNQDMEKELAQTCISWMLKEDHTGKPRHFKKEIPFPGDICPHCNPITPETQIFTHPMIVGVYCLRCHDVLDGNLIDSQAEDFIIAYKNGTMTTNRARIFTIPSDTECKAFTLLRSCGRCKNKLPTKEIDGQEKSLN